MDRCPHCDAPRFPDTTFCHRCLTPYGGVPVTATAPAGVRPGVGTVVSPSAAEAPRPARRKVDGRAILRWTIWTLLLLALGYGAKRVLFARQVVLPDAIAGMQKVDTEEARDFSDEAMEEARRRGWGAGAVGLYEDATPPATSAPFLLVLASGVETDAETAAAFLEEEWREPVNGVGLVPGTTRTQSDPRADFACAAFSGGARGTICDWLNEDGTLGAVYAFGRSPGDAWELTSTVYDAVRD